MVEFKEAWPILPIGALAAAEVVLLGMLLGGSAGNIHGKSMTDEPESGRVVLQKGVQTHTRSANLTGTIQRTDEENVNEAVGERLEILRGDLRKKFADALVKAVEKKIERTVDQTEREALSRANSEYFFAIDDRGETGEPRERIGRIGVASKKRMDALSNAVDSEADAVRLLYETMNALETAPSVPGGKAAALGDQ